MFMAPEPPKMFLFLPFLLYLTSRNMVDSLLEIQPLKLTIYPYPYNEAPNR